MYVCNFCTALFLMQDFTIFHKLWNVLRCWKKNCANTYWPVAFWDYTKHLKTCTSKFVKQKAGAFLNTWIIGSPEMPIQNSLLEMPILHFIGNTYMKNQTGIAYTNWFWPNKKCLYKKPNMKCLYTFILTKQEMPIQKTKTWNAYTPFFCKTGINCLYKLILTKQEMPIQKTKQELPIQNYFYQTRNPYTK